MNYAGDDAIRYIYSQGLAKGTGGQQTLASFNGSKTLTRAEAVQFIKNLADHGVGELLARPEQSSDTSLLPDIPFGSESASLKESLAQDSRIPALKLNDKAVIFHTKPVRINGVYMMPATSLENLWFAVNGKAMRFADLMIITGGQEDKSQLNYYSYKRHVLAAAENIVSCRSGTETSKSLGMT